MWPLPAPDRSARNWPLVSEILRSNPWISFGLSPSPRPLSGSLLVTEISVNPASPARASSTVTDAVTVTSLWFGDQMLFGLTLQNTVGAVPSRKTVMELEKVPLALVAVQVSVVPVGGVSVLMVVFIEMSSRNGSPTMAVAKLDQSICLGLL